MKPQRAALPLVFALLCTLPAPAHACFWDKDTLSMEMRRFPSTLELITGKFVRHSTAFYQWRITDRRAKLEATPDALPLLDDLGVALDKTGDHAGAIETGRRALALDEGRYESHANLGTYLLHSGQFAEGLKHIQRAIAINPDAHFGREVVQQRLVEYVLAQRKKHPDGLPLRRTCISKHPRLMANPYLGEGGRGYLQPNAKNLCLHMRARGGFARFALAKGISQADAVKGVLGMMRFSNHTHPILLEVLGDLLLGLERGNKMGKADAKRLAARAYLSAAINSPDEAQANAYKAKAALTLVTHRFGLKEMEKQLQNELRAGAKYFSRIEKNERRWIDSGKDPEAAFDKKYNRKR